MDGLNDHPQPLDNVQAGALTISTDLGLEDSSDEEEHFVLSAVYVAARAAAIAAVIYAETYMETDVDSDTTTVNGKDSAGGESSGGVSPEEALRDLPPPSSPVRSSNPSASQRTPGAALEFSSRSKRRRSEIETPAESSIGGSTGQKKQRVSGVVALNGIREEIARLGASWDQYHSARMARHRAVGVTVKGESGQGGRNGTATAHISRIAKTDPLSAIRSQAAKEFEQRAANLLPEETIAMIDLFNTDPNAARIYLSFLREDTRVAWVRKHLVKLGFPQRSGVLA